MKHVIEFWQVVCSDEFLLSTRGYRVVPELLRLHCAPFLH